MPVEQVVSLARQTMEAAFWIAAPMLIAATVVSLVINILQVMTSIQDVTVMTVPRLAVVGAIVLLLTPWMLHRLLAFTTTLFGDFRMFTQ